MAFKKTNKKIKQGAIIMASKKYPPGQKPAKPTMAQAFNAAQGAAVNRPSTNKAPVKPNFFGSAAESRAATAAPVKAVVKFFKEGGVSGQSKPAVKPIPPKEKADIVAQGKAADKKATAARMATDAKYDKVGAKKAAASSSTSSTSTTSTTSTSKAAKPYVKLKQAPREAARRAYVQKQLDRLGIKPTPAGKPRSAKEKAARAKARATWDKKNPFVPKKSTPMPDSPKQSGWTGPGPGPMKNKPE
jgi:hypothetical protein